MVKIETTSFSTIQEYAIQKLAAGLSPMFTYHHVKHTLNVLEQCEIIAGLEGVSSKEAIFLLKVSALYHDMGFLKTYQGHEEKSCEIAKADLTQFGLADSQQEEIFAIIRSTQVPQTPLNNLGKIMCDADLDYLGRNDFFEIGEGLYQEFLWQGIVKNEIDWQKTQVRFLENHKYFTESSKQRRELTKQQNLALVKEKLAKLEKLQ